MSLRNQILRHQLLLTRLIKTQAKKTKAVIDKAHKIVIKAVRNRNPAFLQLRLQQELDKLPKTAMEMVSDLAHYESKYTADKLSQYSNNSVKYLTKDDINGIIPEIKVKATAQATPLTISNTYKKFAEIKAAQYAQLVSDLDIQDVDEEDALQQIQEKTDGLFSTQNLALASLVILGTANFMRNQVSDINNLQVDWVLDLELDNCADCQAMADDGPYDPEEVDSMIPMHYRCGCSLVPIIDDQDEA